jgi:hypothetical protein
VDTTTLLATLDAVLVITEGRERTEAELRALKRPLVWSWPATG